MLSYFKTIRACRSCGGRNLKPVLTLGRPYVSNFVDGSSPKGGRVPLELVLCDAETGGCGLLQLKHTVSPERMYRQYWYHSGMNPMMQEALAEITEEIESRVPLQKGDLVLDIGCNDGTLLRSYRTPGLILAGFEPAKNIIVRAREGTHQIINNFFNYGALRRISPGRRAKVITSIAMFYDLDDPNRFVSDLVRCLDSDGIWVIQMNYLSSMLEQNSLDNICHEHLEYYSLTSLLPLLRRHGLGVLDVTLNTVNGGSFRATIGRKGNPFGSQSGKGRVARLLEAESRIGLHTMETYRAFAKRTASIKERLRRLIQKESTRGKKIYAYGASTKGNTLLQYCGLDSGWIAKAVDKNRDKWGRKTIGTNIPIISEEQARKERPDYFLILPWHFLKEFKKREKEYLKSGGKFIVPLPEVRVVEAEDR